LFQLLADKVVTYAKSKCLAEQLNLCVLVAALIVSQAWILLINQRAIRRKALHRISFFRAREREGMANLNNGEATNMLRLKRFPFNHLVSIYRGRGIALEDAVSVVSAVQITAILRLCGRHGTALVRQ
jgi:hypothetical protein